MLWENVNITFDNDSDDYTIPRDERAWRARLPMALQHEYLSGNLNSVDIDATVSAPRPSTKLDLNLNRIAQHSEVTNEDKAGIPAHQTKVRSDRFVQLF